MRCVNLIDKSVALAGGKCKCCGCNCNCCKCGSKCKCKMRVACVTRPTRQKRLQNAENLLLKIRVESSNKLIQSACVGTIRCQSNPVSIGLCSSTVCPVSTSVSACAMHCATPQSMQHKSAHNGLHCCVC